MWTENHECIWQLRRVGEIFVKGKQGRHQVAGRSYFTWGPVGWGKDQR